MFRYPEGSPMRLYFQLEGLDHRPQLIKNALSRGACSCDDPRDAHYILVNRYTEQGRQFVREWSRVPVLDYLWIDKCIAVGRCLLGSENFGGCLVVDDGLPLKIDGHTPHLPTPGNTPEQQNSSTSRSASTSTLPLGDFAPIQQMASSSMSSVPDASMSGMMSMVMPQYNFSPGFPNHVGPSNAPMITFNPFPQTQYPLHSPQSLNAQVASQQMMAAMGNIQDMLSQFQVPGAPCGNNPFLFSQSEPLLVSTSQMGYSQPDEPSTSSTPVDSRSRPRVVSKKRKRGDSTASDDFGNDSGASSSPKADSRDSHGNAEDLFTQSGEPLKFYVQLDMPSRNVLVNDIRKNGGKLVTEQEQADYVVLFKSTKKRTIFDQLLSEANRLEKNAVEVTFVHDCIAKNRLLKPRVYLFDDQVEDTPKLKPKEGKKCGRPPKASKQKSTVKEKQSKEPQVTARSVKIEIPDAESLPVKTSRKKTIVSRSAEKAKEEAQQFRDLAEGMNPKPKTTKQKASVIEEEHRPTLDHVTEDARVSQSSTPSLPLPASTTDVPSSSEPSPALPSESPSAVPPASVSPLSTVSSTPPAQSTSHACDSSSKADYEMMLNHDLNLFASYLASDVSEDSNGEDDDKVFARLESEHKCLSSESWSALWDTHHAEIENRYYAIIEAEEHQQEQESTA
ncbi:hypothetical protein FISHEDRAFT_71571 [Fistulina hepatica ATCC 64428]|uniref:BRCT domain-containing protein n=1 Tax=Fistulina hepatica ATCC 64428 TaxID=1128425 RepID=A0A0D7AGH0_9AGAR|nr:hypothetical protein FISHEDRAFT_71571 [Fistulina hepatica ATCC 64428]